MTNQNADVMLMSWNGRAAHTMTNENADVRVTNAYVMLVRIDD